MKLIKEHIVDVPDFPKKGVVFKDITPLLNNPEAFNACLNMFEAKCKSLKIDRILAIESRGFIFGSPLADRLNCGLVLARKPGKLPRETVSESFKLEYGEDSLEIHKDAIKEGENVLIIDDVLATGGTMEACAKLVSKVGAKVEHILFLMELSFLSGKDKLNLNGKAIPYYSIISY